WLPIVEFIDDQHESYMRQEQQPHRKEKLDMRPLDIEIMKRLGSRVNLIPVIAKADTLTPNDLDTFKRKIREVIATQNIQVYQCPVE
ncbi:11425_t:CDS:2, partial [Entrophospora sp. SA101]